MLKTQKGSKCASKTDPEENKNLNKVVIFVFFMQKMYSHKFIKLRLNHWCHMDYFSDVLTTILGLERAICITVWRGRKLSDFIILICVVKMNEGLMGLERHEGE